MGVELLPTRARNGERHAGNDHLTPEWIGNTNHRHFPDGRMRCEHRLDLLRIDALAARPDHVIDTPDEIYVTIVAQDANIASEIPAVA